MNAPYAARVAPLRKQIASAGCDALLVTHLPNVFYLCGFTGSAGALLVEGRSCTLFTDGRYTIQARQEVSNARVVITAAGPLKAAGERLRDRGAAAVGLEQAYLTIAQKAVLRASSGRKVRWRMVGGLVEGLRAVKEPGELALMRKAARLAQAVLADLLKLVRPGVLEMELAAELEYRMRRAGASGPAFDTIVASGPRTALPHARPTARRLRRGELVLFDLGAILSHYCSDLTRTVYLGRAPERVRQWHTAVWEAHEAARHAAQPGAPCEQVDRAARQVLERYRLDKYFTHSTGHGLGLEVHEEPRLARGQKRLLKSGNAITIEPGIYVEGVGGIRIENAVVVAAGGPKPITRIDSELIQL